MPRPDRKRSIPLCLEALEERLNLSTPTLLANVLLPGAGAAWNWVGQYHAAPLMADLDGDGQQEIITVGADKQLYAYKYNPTNGSVFIDHQYNQGPWTDQIQSTAVVVNTPNGPAIFAGNDSGWVFGWYARTGALIPGWPQNIGPGNTPDPVKVIGSLAAGDLEGTGLPDIVVPGTNHEITAFHFNGTVFWKFNNDDTVTSGIAIGDLQGDGKLDVVVGGDSSASFAYWSGGKIEALSWDGRREWVKATPQTIWSSPVLADLQGNGKLDVVVGTGYYYGTANPPNYPGNLVYALDPNGNDLPGWPYSTGPASINAQVFSSPAIADLTGDGELDTIVADTQGKIHAIRPNGQPLWVVQAFQPGFPNLTSAIVADFNGDGLPDVFMSGLNQSSQPFLGAWDGGSGIQLWDQPDTYLHFQAGVVGHFRGDGSWQMAVVGDDLNSNAQLLSPTALEIYDLGDSSLTPPWGQFRQDASADAVARPTGWATALIDQLYANALHRAPSTTELNNVWLPAFLHAGSLAPDIYAILSSAEARQVQITSWYQNYLGRTPDPTGLANWQQYLAGGGTYAIAQAAILASPEAFALAGNTNPAWVVFLYQKLLGRSPSATELNNWVAGLNANQTNRYQVAIGFLLSPEHTQDLVLSWYQAYQPGGMAVPSIDNLQAASWDLRRGKPEELTLMNILMSQGDYMTTQLEGSYLRAAYQDVLGRPISPAEAVSWLAQLEQGLPLNAVAYTLTHSAEHYALLVTGWYQGILGRTPSPAEIAPWVNAMLGGVSWQAILFDLVTSDEFWQQTGGNLGTFINQAYLDLLGRAATAAEINYWLSNAQTENLRVMVPLTILFGAPTEFYERMVSIWYYEYLRRLPSTPPDSSVLIPPGTPFGGQSFVNDWAGGASPADLEYLIVASAEYTDIAYSKAFWYGARWLNF